MSLEEDIDTYKILPSLTYDALGCLVNSRPGYTLPHGLTLQLATADGSLLSESYAILDNELLAYFSGALHGFPALKRLGELSSEEETPVEEEAREALAREVAELARLASRREVPSPPDWVGLEGTGDIRLGEELGWRGLLDFLQRVEHLLFLARRAGLELWILPEA